MGVFRVGLGCRVGIQFRIRRVVCGPRLPCRLYRSRFNILRVCFFGLRWFEIVFVSFTKPASLVVVGFGTCSTVDAAMLAWALLNNRTMTQDLPGCMLRRALP